jgi:hypothetical protein
VDEAKKTAGARPNVEVDGFCGIAFNAGKSLASSRVQIDAGRGNGGTFERDEAGGRKFKERMLDCMERSKNG